MTEKNINLRAEDFVPWKGWSLSEKLKKGLTKLGPMYEEEHNGSNWLIAITPLWILPSRLERMCHSKNEDDKKYIKLLVEVFRIFSEMKNKHVFIEHIAQLKDPLEITTSILQYQTPFSHQHDL